MKVRGPLFSQVAHGWLGKASYARVGVVSNPYPLALLGKIHVPYSLWDRQIFGMYAIPAFSLRPYANFISQYYSPIGWCYQERRTWHGMQPVIQRPSLGTVRNTLTQTQYRNRFADAVITWQGFDPTTKNIYNKLSYPKKMSGYNRFIKLYITRMPLAPLTANYILVEDGNFLITETNDKITLE